MDDKTNQSQVSDEIINENNRYYELLKKGNLSDEEKKELDDLKQNYGLRVQKKVNKLMWETKTEREAREKAEKEAEELREENKRLKAEHESVVKPEIKPEIVKINGKVFYSDSTLRAMVESEKMTDQEAWEHRDARLLARAEENVYSRIKDEQSRDESASTMREDSRVVLAKYPHFDKNHKDFDPNDPLYLEATKIYQDFIDPRTGLPTNPRALSRAVEMAERLVGKKPSVDMSDHLNVSSSSSTGHRTPKGKETEFSENEKETALRLYTNQINQKTGRYYTNEEAILKAKKAKAERETRRAER